MPILFKCECGTPGMVPDEMAGQNYTCHTCGHEGVIPSESSSDCVLVFKDGFPNEGTPYDKADFLKKLSEHFFTGHDLVFVNGSWVPISHVFDAPPLPAPPPPNGGEIATTFAELPPIPGVYAEFAKKSPKRRKLKMKFLLRVVLPIVLALLFISFFVLVKPIRNKVKLRCSYVLVFNPDAKNYTAELCGKSLNLPANSSCLFQDVVPWFYGKKTLKIKGQGGTVVYKVNVPLLPNYDVVVSPGAKLKFETFDDNYRQNVKSESVKTDALVKELSTNSAPTVLHSLCGELYDIGIRQHINSLNEEIYSQAEYSFGMIGIRRSEKYKAKFKNANLERKGKPELVRGGVRLSIVNADFTFDANNKNTPYTLKLPKLPKVGDFPPAVPCKAIEKFQANKGKKGKEIITVHKSANPERITVSFDAKGEKMNVVMVFHGDLKSERIVYGKKKPFNYTGNWKYTAVLNLSGANSGKWSWEWRFNGNLIPEYATAPKPPIEIIYEKAVNGSEKVSIKGAP